MLEKIFENTLWSSRFVVIMAVLFGLVGALALFIVASYDIYNVAKYIIDTYANHTHPLKFHEIVVGEIIGAVDLYLIGVVMLLFSFGLYELFISEIDPAKGDMESNKILSINSLDQLKDKISKVIVMVLVVSFFKKVGLAEFTTPLELLYLALSITAVSVGLYFLSKVGHHH
ncbi:Arginine/ornithine antiporter ArcD [hydrothermal vent metagenome]|uniref:Arginine/ornithine antiporter ArcD n=1 Tax=hydrothermal vent metagenome TaxID=652676 RepID=A0A1W1BQQ6_9ZZZZ